MNDKFLKKAPPLVQHSLQSPKNFALLLAVFQPNHSMSMLPERCTEYMIKFLWLVQFSSRVTLQTPTHSQVHYIMVIGLLLLNFSLLGEHHPNI